MKKNLYVLVILVSSMLPFVASAKVWRVNNNPGIQADFTTPQAAQNAAVAGDTLHIEPSPISYGDLALNKRLTVISTGNFLSQNPGLQYAPAPGTIANLTISTSIAAGSVVSCNFSGTAAVSNCNNIRFERSYIASYIVFTNADSIVFLNSYCASYLVLQTNSNNIFVTNSFLWFIDMTSDCSAYIINNVLGSTLGASGNRNIYASVFQNNIIKNDQSYFYTNSTVVNNLTARGSGSGSLPAGSGNQVLVNMASVFVNPTGTSDRDFLLVSGSLATGAGVNGEDAGAFGGATPFKLGLQPAIPAIYKLIAPSTTVGNSINIVFSTRSNN